MWEADFQIEAMPKSTLKPEDLAEFLERTRGTTIAELALSVAHEIDLQRRAIDWQSKSHASILASIERDFKKSESKVRELELRISDLIASDRSNNMRRYVRTRLEEMLLEL